MAKTVQAEVRKKMYAALKSGRFMITIARVEKRKLHTYTVTKNFPVGDIEKVVQQTLRDLSNDIPEEKKATPLEQFLKQGDEH